jgi:DNA-binding NarL/FixJ family response regulator
MLDRKKVLILGPSPIFRHTLKEVIHIALPKENGIEFIASIKSMVSDSRVVVLSSHNSVEYEAASIEKGADYFLSKENSAGLRLIDVIHDTIRRNNRS